MKRSIGFTLLLLSAVAISGTNGAPLGLLKIFNKFIEVTDIVGQVHPILRNIANDIVNDIRNLIPEVEALLDKHDISDELPKEMGKVINMTFIFKEVLPELEKAMKEANVSMYADEIRGYLEVSRIREDLLPEYDKFMRENNVSAIFDEIRTILNVSFIADMILPELENFARNENISRIVMEIEKFLEMSDVSEKLIPAIVNIMESDNVTRIVRELDNLLNISHIVDQLIPDLEKLIRELHLNDTIAEIKKVLDIVTFGNEALDDLQKMLDESNITTDVPDLKPFLNLTIIRAKLTEMEKILNYTTIPDMVHEVERLLDMNYLRGKVHDLDEFLESLGLSKLLRDIKELLDISFINDKAAAIKKFLKSGNITHMLADVEKKLLNASYIRKMILPELKRMLRESNLTNWVDEAERMMSTDHISENILPEIEEMLRQLNVTDQLKMLLDFLNITILKEELKELDKELNITERGERIAEGELSDVVIEILDDLFKKEELVSVMPTLPGRPTPTAAVKTTKKPVVCIDDCQGVPCGTAIKNSCGTCVLGTTGLKANHGKDCNNVCSGRARIDKCNRCTNPPKIDRSGTDSLFADCHGTCFGSAVNDSCGVCSGGLTGKAVDHSKDACGLCGGDNSTCKGCDGVPMSGKVIDSCNVCDGDGSSCTTITMVIPSLIPSSSSSLRTVMVIGAGLVGDDANSVKCVFDGQESQGVSINRTHAKCDIPNDVAAGEKDFTVKVVKSGAKVATSNLKVQIYDSVATKITSLSPSELFTHQPSQVTFAGNGLTDSRNAVCVVSDGTKTIKIRATFAANQYTCSLPAVAASRNVTIALSLNGVHQLASDVSLQRTVFASAPEIDAAQFSNSGALVYVRFTKNIDTSSLGKCDAVFNAATVPILGASPKCRWSGGRHLIISPGAGATIVPTNSLTLKASAVKCARELYSKFASGQVTVNEAELPVQPVAVIVGPQQVSSCGNLSLDGSQSTGGGGRALKYKWSLVGALGANIVAALDAAEDKTKVVINGNYMIAGSSYTIRLDVQNFLSATWKSTTIKVKKVAVASPEVRVIGPLGGKVKPSRSFYITAKAKAASCSSQKALSFTWTVVCTNDDGTKSAQAKVENSEGFKTTSFKAALKIAAGSLVGGKNYTFTLVVALKALPSILTTVETTVAVGWSELEPAILGGDRTLGRGSGALVLDAMSSTYDPDKAPGTLSCSWVCQDKSDGQPCYSAVSKGQKIVMADQCVITVQSSEFEDGKSYEITSQVSKGSRTKSSSIVLTVVAGKPPAVSVVRPKIRVAANKKVPLQGVFRSGIKPTKIEWSCAEDDDYRYIDLSDTSLFVSHLDTYNPDKDSFAMKVLKPNVLTPGATYKFILTVNDGSSIGSSNMIVEVRNGPTSGIFRTSAATVKELDTVTLSAPLWTTDADAYPLQYTFGYVNSAGRFKSWVTQLESEYMITVPPGYGATNQVTLRLVIKDKFGSLSSLDKVVNVTRVSLDADVVEKEIEKSLKEANESGDYTTAVPKMNSFLLAVKQAPLEIRKKVTKTAVDTLLGAAAAGSLDADKAKPILETLLNVLPANVEKSRLKDVMSGAKEIVKASESIDKETADSTLDWVDSMADTADLNDKEVLKGLSSIYQSVGDSLSQSVSIGETVETASANSKAVIKVARLGLDSSVPAKTGSDATSVNFGDELGDQYAMWECVPGKMCSGATMTMVSYDEDYFSGLASTKSSGSVIADKIVSISLKNPETNEYLVVSNLGKPVVIEFKTGAPSSGKKLTCYYFDEDKQTWSSEGVTCSLVGDKLVTRVTHLTAFSPAEEDISSSQSPEKTYQVSFLLSNTTWKDEYSDKTGGNYTTLKNQILQEISDVYQGDSTLTKLDLLRFEDSGGFVRVVLKMSFVASNSNPSEKLKQSIADGKLGTIDVDASSLDWVEVYDQSDSEDDDYTNIIIGVVVGAAVGLVIIAIIVWCCIHHKKPHSKIRSHPDMHDGSHKNEAWVSDSRHGMTPV